MNHSLLEWYTNNQFSYNDYNCESNYIALASESTDGSIFNPRPGTGRYHSGCRLLYHWSRLLITTGSLSIFRPILQAIPVFEPSYVTLFCLTPFIPTHGLVNWLTSRRHSQWTVKYSREGKFARLHSPSRTYILRTVFSAVPAVLYLACAFILGTSRFITGPETTEEWYRPIYIVCLSLVCASFIMSLHQAMSTGVAAWHLRGYEKTRHGVRPAV